MLHTILCWQVAHPIHDQCFYLTNEHKKKLKEEYGQLRMPCLLELEFSLIDYFLVFCLLHFQELNLGHLNKSLVRQYLSQQDAPIKSGI